MEKIYEPEVIQDSQLPNQAIVDTQIVKRASRGVSQPTTIHNNQTPSRKIAVELLSSALNTKSRKILGEFEFTESGAIQVGKYESGVSGDIKISPSGIVARDTSGSNTFTLDGETGSATFAGSIQAGSIITGLVSVGNNNVVIDGANKRIVINDGTNDRVLIGYQAGGF